jgi:hypothetical protein
MAALAEFAGGILLMLGLLFRPALALMLVVLFVLGPGRYSLDAWLAAPESPRTDAAAQRAHPGGPAASGRQGDRVPRSATALRRATKPPGAAGSTAAGKRRSFA